jgi:hypothetical protein
MSILSYMNESTGDNRLLPFNSNGIPHLSLALFLGDIKDMRFEIPNILETRYKDVLFQVIRTNLFSCGPF